MGRRSLREITGPGPAVGWGPREAFGVVLAAHVVLILAGSIVVGSRPSGGTIPIVRQFVATVPFWLTALGLSWWLASKSTAPGDREPADARRSLGLAIRPLDVPLGIAIGVALQLAIIPALYRLFGADLDELERPARELADASRGTLATVLFVVMTCLAAPVAEETLYRAVLQRGVGRTWAVTGVVGAALVFGLAHFQPLQLPGLALFGAASGLAVWWTGRLGPGVVAHMAFNASTVVVLLSHR